MKNIVETAAAAEQLKFLIAAVKVTGLVDTLKGPGPFTVFAPTDEAFANLPVGTFEGLLKDLPRLKAVLKYHVVDGKFLSKDVFVVRSAKTVLGGELRVDTTHGVKIKNAAVTKVDIESSNGVIHVIDTVLIPQ